MTKILEKPINVNLKSDLVLVAAGSGSRFLSSEPKQFKVLEGKKLYLWALETFLTWNSYASVAIVVSEKWVEQIQLEIKKLKIEGRIVVVKGGETRTDSVRAGLEALSVSTSPTVMVHDAARPCLSLGLLNRLWDGLRGQLEVGVVPVRSVTETLKIVRNELIISTVDRSEFKTIQTPQIFKKEILLEAYRRVGKTTFPDDASLMESLGYKIKTVEGDAFNIKVTHTEDLKYVSSWIRDGHSSL